MGSGYYDANRWVSVGGPLAGDVVSGPGHHHHIASHHPGQHAGSRPGPLQGRKNYVRPGVTGTYVKRFDTASCFVNEIETYQRLVGLGITPDLLEYDEETMAMTIESYGAPIDIAALSKSDKQIFADCVFDIIATMHAAGVAHRDIHQENILVGPKGPRVIDFEWSHRAFDSLRNSLDLTGPPGIESRHVPQPPLFWDSPARLGMSRLTGVTASVAYDRYIKRLRGSVAMFSGFKTGSPCARDGLVYQSLPHIGIPDSAAQRKTGVRARRMGLSEFAKGQDVLDLGSNLGAMSILSGEAGATSVRGIELDPNRVEIARRIAAVAGVHDRVTFENRNIVAALSDLSGFSGAILSLAVDVWVPDADDLYRLIANSGANRVLLETNKHAGDPDYIVKTFSPTFSDITVVGSTAKEDAFGNHRVIVSMRGRR